MSGPRICMDLYSNLQIKTVDVCGTTVVVTVCPSILLLQVACLTCFFGDVSLVLPQGSRVPSSCLRCWDRHQWSHLFRAGPKSGLQGAHHATNPWPPRGRVKAAAVEVFHGHDQNLGGFFHLFPFR